MLANIRAEPRDAPSLSNEDQEILKHLVQRHGLNPPQALDVRQVPDESCITTLTGSAGAEKSKTLVACNKAVLWQAPFLLRTPIMLPLAPSIRVRGWGDLREIAHPAHVCW